MTQHVESIKLYALIFGALLVLTLTTVFVAEIDLGDWNIVVALLIAFMKASLVVWFFMHVRHTTGMTRLFVVAGLFWLCIMFTLTFSDYLTRLWTAIGRPWQ